MSVVAEVEGDEGGNGGIVFHDKAARHWALRSLWTALEVRPRLVVPFKITSGEQNRAALPTPPQSIEEHDTPIRSAEPLHDLGPHGAPDPRR